MSSSNVLIKFSRFETGRTQGMNILAGFGFVEPHKQMVRPFRHNGCVSPRREKETEVTYIKIFDAEYELGNPPTPWHFGLSIYDQSQIGYRLHSGHWDAHGNPILYNVYLDEREWKRIEAGELPPTVLWMSDMTAVPVKKKRCRHCGQALP